MKNVPGNSMGDLECHANTYCSSYYRQKWVSLADDSSDHPMDQCNQD